MTTAPISDDRRDDLTRALDDGRIRPRIVAGRVVVDAETLRQLMATTSQETDNAEHRRG